MSETTQVNVRILDKEYQFACREEERVSLLQAADYLDRMMREIRESGRIVGLDRIAVMAALNMANELLHHQNSEQAVTESSLARIRRLQGKLGAGLGNNADSSSGASGD
ncbi:cell division protein ZapA [Natronospira proteinivora]|uniref:Cell division protein ZapA n=1 Tax=Natronospira proteinivora TaxID=1807133 RepID=A0ABT1G8B3_9GAMM|nr:cell division protein ZapA [Natronospira proteinivora]MCP1727530.1 cell division protein ZapA [Natronospira proteinivora]